MPSAGRWIKAFFILGGFLALWTAVAFPAPAVREDNPEALAVIARLRELPAPIPWEARGILVAEAPGEYYRLEFRLLARGPEALRLELFDPFGRPLYYLTVNRGRVQALSPGDKEPFPLNPALLAGALTAETGFTLGEALSLLWGRVPLIPFDPGQAVLKTDTGGRFIQLVLNGESAQTVRIKKEPFQVEGSLLKARKGGGPLQVSFADFAVFSGSTWPKEIRVRDEEAEKEVTIRYDQILPRSDFPEGAFLINPPPSTLK